LEAKKLKKIMKIPGEHNIQNALAALTVAKILKIPDKVSFKSLSEYRGSWRRFEEHDLKIGNCRAKRGFSSSPSLLHAEARKLKIVSDYGHHPTEVRVTLKAVREKYPNKRIWCLFQPHQYQRTFYLFKNFVEVLKSAPIDKIIVTDIYDVAGRETPGIRKKVSSQKLVKVISKKTVIYLPKDNILDYLKKNLRGGEVVVIMGAGDIYDLTIELRSKRV
ncbi:MAG: cyanophycin synthetase, partial [Candidatus Wildermuthbacteria bacterium]|nr:cyanophycin synthetase [Candidatus Wildermuthbacteria bacterium]